MQMLKVVAEFSGRNWAAFSPNLPGVYATGDTLKEAVSQFLGAVQFHLEGLAEEGDTIPALDYSKCMVASFVPPQYLGKWRRSLGLTQQAVARSMGLPQARISELEKTPGTVSFDRVHKYLREIGKMADLLVPPAIAESENCRVA